MNGHTILPPDLMAGQRYGILYSNYYSAYYSVLNLKYKMGGTNHVEYVPQPTRKPIDQ